MDKTQLFAALNKGVSFSAGVGLVGVLLVLMLSVVLTRRLTSPLRHMAKVATRLAGGDRSVRTRLKTGDEIGQLSSAFDSMAAEIERSQQDLERRIGERTASLDRELAERRKTEEQYRQLATRQTLILEHAGEGIYGLDTKGHTSFANEAAVGMLGWSQTELLGKSQHDLIHHSKPDGSPYPREECHIYAAFSDGKTHAVSDEVFWRKDGDSFPVAYTSTPIREDGKLQGAVVIFRDITEQKLAERKIQRLNVSLERKVAVRTAELYAVNQELESFAYSVAHDLRAPLRAIDGFSQALLEDYGEQLDGVAKEYLGYCREGSQEMSRLIDDLLKLSRATRGAISREDFDLSQLTAEIMEDLRRDDPERNVVTDIIPGIVVNADRRLLRAVMENLLGNAWKFTARKALANIEFGAGRSNGRVRCFVRDNGAGFDMAYKNKLFEPFRRLHSQEDFEGTGIGLATVQRIINRHGGTVVAEGVVGEGACFTFELDPPEHDNE